MGLGLGGQPGGGQGVRMHGHVLRDVHPHGDALRAGRGLHAGEHVHVAAASDGVGRAEGAAVYGHGRGAEAPGGGGGGGDLGCHGDILSAP